MGVAMWPMVELEADDALASAAHLAAADARVEKVCIWTPDKDLAQCVRGDRVVQVDPQSGQDPRRRGVRGEVRRRAGAHSRLPRARRRRRRTAIPASAGIGAEDGGARSSTRTAPSRSFRPTSSAQQREHALLFKTLATLRTDAPLFADVDELRWHGPSDALASIMEKMGDSRLPQRLGEIRHGSH